MAEGWLTDYKNNTRYFYPQNGVMATGWFSYKGNNYYFRSNGAMYRNTTVTIGGRTYLLTAMASHGKVRINGISFWRSTETTRPQTSWYLCSIWAVPGLRS